MNVLFHTNQLCLRGTTSAIFNYASANESVLGNTSFVICERNNKSNNQNMIAFFEKAFPNRVFLYNSFSEVEGIVARNKIDVVYYIKGGWRDGKLVGNAKNVVHTVFRHYKPHGQVYAYLSDWLRDSMAKVEPKAADHPIVYPIVDMQKSTDNLRKQLNIPEDAIVFGRHGGGDSFDVLYAHQAVKTILEKNNNIYFLFLNTNKFFTHERLIHLPSLETHDDLGKSAFINTCDCMLHARKDGETFSSAIAEFLFHDKPVMTNTDCEDRDHIDYRLKEHGIYYRDHDSLVNQLEAFSPKNYTFNYSSLVEPFNKQNAMKRFAEIFLS